MRHELRGERTGIRYQLTDRVTVQVSRVDLDARKIDLRLVNEPNIRTTLKNEARRFDADREKKTQSKSPRNSTSTVKTGKSKIAKSNSRTNTSVSKKAPPVKASAKPAKKKR